MRENVTVTTPVTQATVVLRGYVTGRMKQAIESAFLDNMETTPDGQTKFSSGAITEATNRALEAIVVSVNGSTENVLDAVLDMPEQDYDFVTSEVNKVRTPLAPTTSNASKTATTTS